MLDWQNPNTWHVLVIDDEPANLKLVELYFTFLKANVNTAANGQAGLEILKGYRPDIILLDLSMPVMDGWAMKRLLDADAALCEIPVIALTAMAMPLDEERAYRAGFDGYITKPINLPTLLDDLHETMMAFAPDLVKKEAVA